MKILVTGGAGFIGSHVTDALVAKGHRVTVLDDLSSGKKEWVHPRARFVRGKVETPATAALVRRLKPDAIFHFAAQKDARLSVADPVMDARINVLGLLQLVAGARAAGTLKRFVFTSTGGAIYGGARTVPTPETYPAHPLSPYGVSKLASEHYLHSYRHAGGGIPFVSLRFSNVYGPRQTPKSEAGVVAIFADAMLRGRRPVIFGDGKQTRDFVYVSDVVDACLKALVTKDPGIYNVGTGVETDLRELARLLRALTGADAVPVYGPAKAGEERRSAVDARRAAKGLGWRPKIALAQGLAKTVAWQKAQASRR